MTFNLRPGASLELEVRITPPEQDITLMMPLLYSGFVEIRSANEGDTETENYSVPYIGIPYDRYAVGPIGMDTSHRMVYGGSRVR